jgi:hypothetical protein
MKNGWDNKCNLKWIKYKNKKNGDIAQLVERWIEDPSVVGSIPSVTTKF